MKKRNVLLLGESYTAVHTYIRGSNHVTLPRYGHFVTRLARLLEGEGFSVQPLLTHEIPERCPVTREAFARYDAVILSDVGSDTMLAQPESVPGAKRYNRLKELAAYVKNGGGLLMIGGYFGFSGIGNQARYGMTPLAEVLPVEIFPYDDRVECPEGVFPDAEKVSGSGLFEGVRMESCPAFRGYNKTVLKKDSVLFASFDGDPFLAGSRCKAGRSFAFTSDCAPDWAPQEVLDWEDYPRLLGNIVRWTAGEIQ